MRESDLRSVLLIKAIEESDRDGTLIPMADRAGATREISRAAAQHESGAAVAPIGSGGLPARAQRLLAQRAEVLRKQVGARFPVLENMLALARGPAWVGWVLIAASLVLGFALSALDGSRRINVLAFPLLGLLVWNLIVYVGVVANWLRASKGAKHEPWLASFIARGALGRLRRLIAKSARFNAPLADAVGRFAKEWSDAAAPALVARATRLFHLCAAAVGIGLIAGLYLRGIGLRYEAGWESTFLGAEQVRTVIRVLYGPASAITGLPLPDLARLEVMRWDGTHRGENAAPWIHLLAATVLLFIVIPRLALALLSTVTAWRCAHALPLPANAAPYFRRVFAGAGDLLGQGATVIVPYAYEPPPNTVSALRTLLSAAFGGTVAAEVPAVVRYGEEEAFVAAMPARLAGSTEAVVLLFSLAATPEEENHGTLIEGVRDQLTKARTSAGLLVAIDEGPYAARMAGQGADRRRLDERRLVWRAFVVARGLQPYFVDLGSDAVSDEAIADALRAALWHAPHA